MDFTSHRRALVCLLLVGCGAASAEVPELETAAEPTAAGETVAPEIGEGPTHVEPLEPPPSTGSMAAGFDTNELPSQGPVDAAVVVDVFSDFECPYCSLARRHTARLLEDFPSVRVRYRHFPLPSHLHAGTAAEASVEAYAQGGEVAFWCFHEQVFDHQSALSRALLLELATRCDLNAVTMRQALEDHRHAERVRQDRVAGDALGVEGTPSFAVNGTLVAGAAYTDVEEAVERVHPSF